MRSLIADPSAKNSGEETTSHSTPLLTSLSFTVCAVPTGTVDLLIMILYVLLTFPIVSTTALKALKSVYYPKLLLLFRGIGGVFTQMNTTSASLIAYSTSAVNLIFPYSTTLLYYSLS